MGNLNQWPTAQLESVSSLLKHSPSAIPEALLAELEAAAGVTPPTIHPRQFRQQLLIDANGAAVPLAEAMDGWQREDFEAMDEAWLWVAEGGPPPANPPLLTAYCERPKSHSKTTDFAVMASWVLHASQRKLLGLAVSGDKDQAKLLRDGMDQIARLNPWLNIRVYKYDVVNPNTGSELKIMAADSHSSHGPTPDFVIVDELTNWKTNLESFWHTMYAATAKRTPCVLVIIANAGLGQGQSWQWKVRETMRESPRVYFHSLKEFSASWLDRSKVFDEQSKILPLSVFNRLWRNIWSTGEGDALDPADIDACVTERGPLPPRQHLESKGLGDWTFTGGLDVGIKHDHSAFVVLGSRYGDPRIRLAYCKTWKPKSDGRVLVSEIERDILAAHGRYRLNRLWYDPDQARYMAERLMRGNDPAGRIVCEEMNFVGRKLNIMASTIVETFRTRMIDLYEDADLIRDLKRLVIVENNFGLKLEAAKTIDGHADSAFALAIALPDARKQCHYRAKETAPLRALRRKAVDPTSRGVQFRRT